MPIWGRPGLTSDLSGDSTDQPPADQPPGQALDPSGWTSVYGYKPGEPGYQDAISISQGKRAPRFVDLREEQLQKALDVTSKAWLLQGSRSMLGIDPYAFQQQAQGIGNPVSGAMQGLDIGISQVAAYPWAKQAGQIPANLGGYIQPFNANPEVAAKSESDLAIENLRQYQLSETMKDMTYQEKAAYYREKATPEERFIIEAMIPGIGFTPMPPIGKVVRLAARGAELLAPKVAEIAVRGAEAVKGIDWASQSGVLGEGAPVAKNLANPVENKGLQSLKAIAAKAGVDAEAVTGISPKEPWQMTKEEFSRVPLVRTVGKDFEGDLLHGTKITNIKSLIATERPTSSFKKDYGIILPREMNEFSAELLVSEKGQAQQAVMFSRGKGESLAVVTIKPGTKVLDLSDEMTRTGAFSKPPIIRFFKRPVITDDFIDWEVKRIVPKYKIDHPDWELKLREAMDPESSHFDVGLWQRLLVPYAKSKGFGLVRLADETLVTDRAVLSQARKATLAESAAAQEARQYPGSKEGSLFTDLPTGATEMAHRTTVKQALSEGKPVPPEVLTEYPDLVKTAQATAAVPAELPHGNTDLYEQKSAEYAAFQEKAKTEGDSVFRGMFSSMTKNPLKKGETWQSRADKFLVDLKANAEAEVPPVPKPGETPKPGEAVQPEEHPSRPSTGQTPPAPPGGMPTGAEQPPPPSKPPTATGGPSMSEPISDAVIKDFTKVLLSKKGEDVWNQVKELRTQERTKRAGAFNERIIALQGQGVKTEEAIATALNETMSGKLPTADTGLVQGLTDSLRDALFSKVQHTLQDEPFEMISTREALTNALAGKPIPRDVGTKAGSAYTRLVRVFGDNPEIMKVLDAKRPLKDQVERKLMETGVDVKGLGREWSVEPSGSYGQGELLDMGTLWRHAGPEMTMEEVWKAIRESNVQAKREQIQRTLNELRRSKPFPTPEGTVYTPPDLLGNVKQNALIPEQELKLELKNAIDMVGGPPSVSPTTGPLGHSPGATENQIASDIQQFTRKLAATNPDLVKSAQKDPRLIDYILALYKNSLLTGPKTHVINSLTNMTGTVLSPVERGAGILVEQGLARIQGRPPERFWAEVPADAAGAYQGIREGVQAFLQTMATGVNPTHASKYEIRHRLFPGTMGRIIEGAGTAMEAEDAFFYSMNYRAALAAETIRYARRTGLKGDALIQRIAEMKMLPSQELMDRAVSIAEGRLFRDNPGEAINTAIKLRDYVPVLHFVFPFIRTPYNLVRFGLARSPIAAFNPALYRNLARKSPEAADQLGRLLIGSIVAGVVAASFSDGRITGAAPTNPAERDRFYREGKQPFSVRIGDHWLSFQRMEPLNQILTQVALGVQAIQNKDEEQIADRAARAALSIAQNIVSQNYLTGLSNLIQAVNDPQGRGAKFFQGTIAGLVPASSLLRSVTRLTDKNIRAPENFGQNLETGLPGLSKNVPSRLDVFGNETQRQTPFYSPFNVSPDKQNAIDTELGRLKVNPGYAPTTISLIPVTDHHVYQEQSGKALYKALGSAINAPGYSRLDDEQKKQQIDQAISRARTLAQRIYTQKTLTLPADATPDVKERFPFVKAAAFYDDINRQLLLRQDKSFQNTYQEYLRLSQGDQTDRLKATTLRKQTPSIVQFQNNVEAGQALMRMRDPVLEKGLVQYRNANAMDQKAVREILRHTRNAQLAQEYIKQYGGK